MAITRIEISFSLKVPDDDYRGTGLLLLNFVPVSSSTPHSSNTMIWQLPISVRIRNQRYERGNDFEATIPIPSNERVALIQNSKIINEQLLRHRQYRPQISAGFMPIQASFKTTSPGAELLWVKRTYPSHYRTESDYYLQLVEDCNYCISLNVDEKIFKELMSQGYGVNFQFYRTAAINKPRSLTLKCSAEWCPAEPDFSIHEMARLSNINKIDEDNVNKRRVEKLVDEARQLPPAMLAQFGEKLRKENTSVSTVAASRVTAAPPVASATAACSLHATASAASSAAAAATPLIVSPAARAAASAAVMPAATIAASLVHAGPPPTYSESEMHRACAVPAFAEPPPAYNA